LSDKELILAAARLARTAPQQWDEFVTAYQDYTDDKIIAVVQAPVELLQTVQGRAQGLTSLGRVLTDCRKTAESIDKAAAYKPPK
jgi:hypothetical protein